MRWLLLKDLRILRRSPLLVGAAGRLPDRDLAADRLALSGGPGKPKVAFANLVPPDESQFTLGGQKLDAAEYADELFQSVDPIRVKTREEAIEKVRSGEALGALVLPEDAPSGCRARSGSAAASRPRSRSTTTPRTR